MHPLFTKSLLSLCHDLDSWEAVAQFITPLKATGDRQAEQPVVSLQTFLSIFFLALVEVKEVVSDTKNRERVREGQSLKTDFDFSLID